jgi:hypothetical protein
LRLKGRGFYSKKAEEEGAVLEGGARGAAEAIRSQGGRKKHLKLVKRRGSFSEKRQTGKQLFF